MRTFAYTAIGFLIVCMLAKTKASLKMAVAEAAQVVTSQLLTEDEMDFLNPLD
jgi:hypothetical protein